MRMPRAAGLLLLALAVAGSAAGQTFAVLGDTQRTLWEERLLGREQNEAEQKVLVAALAADRPRFVVHLGDITNRGSSAGEWAYFERLTRPLAGIPIEPAVGNHDWWGGDEAMALLAAHFPRLARRHWYADVRGRLGLVWLDSNARALGAAAWEEQRRWFGHTLGELEQNPEVRAILVFDHHAPFTNSKVSGDDRSVQAAFVGPFLGARKTLALFSGHAHGYEHFHERGKEFIVSGGGGGPRVAYHEGQEARHRDLFTGPAPRPLHYLLVTEEPGRLAIRARGLDHGQTAVRVFDEIVLPLPALRSR